MSDKVKEEILNEMETAENAVPDFHPDWKYEKNGVQVFTLRNGVFNRLQGGSRALEREKKARNGLYTCESADADFVLINYDRDDARPYVKALIAKANKLREVKLLYLSLALHLFMIVWMVTGFVIVWKQIGDTQQANAQYRTLVEQAEKIKPAPVTKQDAAAIFAEPAETPADKYSGLQIK